MFISVHSLKYVGKGLCAVPETFPIYLRQIQTKPSRYGTKASLGGSWLGHGPSLMRGRGSVKHCGNNRRKGDVHVGAATMPPGTLRMQPVWLNGFAGRFYLCVHCSYNVKCCSAPGRHAPLASPFGRGSRAQLGRRGSTLMILMVVIIEKKRCTALSVTCGDSSHRGRAKGL